MKHRPTFLLRFRDAEQFERLKAEAVRSKVSLNEYLLARVESPKLDISRRKVS